MTSNLLSITKSIVVLGAVYLLLAACSKKNLPETEAVLSENGQHKAAYFARIAKHLAVKIGCEGTSLTYGQNEPGVLPPINGAGQTRALYQYPSTLQTELKAYGINANIINRAFPGDRTTEGLQRWEDSTTADVVILEYGTNDCFNFGGYPSNLSVADFATSLTTLVTRRLAQGAWVIINSPPQINPINTALDPYRAAIDSIATTCDLPLFDVVQNVVLSNTDYFDGVHLTAVAYQRWGVRLAPILEKQ